jgi:RHS repeat-associated protein
VHDDLTGTDGWVSNTESIQSFRTVGMAVTVPTFFVGENGRRYYLDRFESTDGGQPGGGWTVFVDRGFAVHDAQQGNVSNELVAVYIRDQQRPTPTMTNTGSMGQGGVRWAAMPPEHGLHSMPEMQMKSPLQFVTSNPPAGQVWRKYYLAGGQRLAMRVMQNGQDDKLYYLLTDHLGSTSVSYDAAHGQVTPQKYMPLGELRGTVNALPTDYTFTGQKWEQEIGLMDFKARFYDPALGRFIQADTVVPGGVQGLDRYAFVFNNPLRYIDPSGHNPACGPDGIYCDTSGRLLNRNRLYESLVNAGFFTLPGKGAIPNPENRTTEHIDKVYYYYDLIRRELFVKYGGKFVGYTGKIDDKVLIALIIGPEASGYRDYQEGTTEKEAYWEVLEAVSNQYAAVYGENGNFSNIQCGGNCTLEEQLAWLTDVQSFYDGKAKVEYVALLVADAELAIGGFCYTQNGSDCASWMWGNVNAVEKAGYGDDIVVELATHWNREGEPDEWFIIH